MCAWLVGDARSRSKTISALLPLAIVGAAQALAKSKNKPLTPGARLPPTRQAALVGPAPGPCTTTASSRAAETLSVALRPEWPQSGSSTESETSWRVLAGVPMACLEILPAQASHEMLLRVVQRAGTRLRPKGLASFLPPASRRRGRIASSNRPDLRNAVVRSHLGGRCLSHQVGRAPRERPLVWSLGRVLQLRCPTCAAGRTQPLPTTRCPTLALQSCGLTSTSCAQRVPSFP